MSVNSYVINYTWVQNVTAFSKVTFLFHIIRAQILEI